MRRYTIIIERAGDNYSAYCPDLTGCIATGSTVAEATSEMRQAIEFHIGGLKKENMAMPEPSSQAAYIEVVA